MNVLFYQGAPPREISEEDEEVSGEWAEVGRGPCRSLRGSHGTTGEAEDATRGIDTAGTEGPLTDTVKREGCTPGVEEH